MSFVSLRFRNKVNTYNFVLHSNDHLVNTAYTVKISTKEFYREMFTGSFDNNRSEKKQLKMNDDNATC